jgi:D-arginine dehydrogenase
MTGVDVVVVGGGIAGLSALAQLARDHRAVLLEREPTLAAHASGRNAAIYRPLERDASSAQLASRSLELLQALDPRAASSFLERRGLLLVGARPDPLREFAEHGCAQGVRCELLGQAELIRRASTLASGEVTHGVWVPDAGTLDIHAIQGALTRYARAASAEVRTGAGVTRIVIAHGRVSAVALDDGSQIDCRAVVIAAGAWGRDLGQACGADLPLTALRRHLVQLELNGAALGQTHPVVWRLDDELYYRPESGGVLASPCDASPSLAGEPPADSAELERLAQKLARTAPALASSRVRRSWACLRTFAPDRELVVGEDSRVPGLYWFAGLGGRGMAVAPAAAEVLAAAMRGDNHPLARVLAPSRLVAG